MQSKSMLKASMLRHILLLIIVMMQQSDASENSCSLQGSETDCTSNTAKKILNHHLNEDPAYKYKRDPNEYSSHLQQLHVAQKNFRALAPNCSCHYAQIKADLKPYKSGITKAMVDTARDRGTLYQVLDGKVYREDKCMFPSRCAGVEHFLLELVDKLPDCEFVVNVRDWPQVTKGENGPVLSFSKQAGVHDDVLYPAWSFWEGGPAIGLHPTGIGRWDLRRKSITKASNKFKWSSKQEKAFFRGSRTSSNRDSIVLLAREDHRMADARYTKNQAWKNNEDTLNATPAVEVSLENHCQYKYLFNFHGVAASFRFKHLFLCGSVVFHETDGWIEFFYPQMKPWIHYVPFPSRPTKDEIKDLVSFARANDATMREIARNGREFIAARLRMADVNCYWKKLLKTYAKLMTYETQLRDDVELVTRKKY